MCVQAAHSEITALQTACDSLKATLGAMQAAHAAADREVASLKKDKALRVSTKSPCSPCMPCGLGLTVSPCIETHLGACSPQIL